MPFTGTPASRKNAGWDREDAPPACVRAIRMTSIHQPLERVSDDEGTIAVGWVGRGVLYARFSGGLSAELAEQYATRLQRFLNEVPSLQYFVDTSDLERYDLLARSTLARLIFANRRKFESLISLAWVEGIGPVAKALSASFGDSVLLLTDPHDFRARLMRAAPQASVVLETMSSADPSALIAPNRRP